MKTEVIEAAALIHADLPEGHGQFFAFNTFDVCGRSTRLMMATGSCAFMLRTYFSSELRPMRQIQVVEFDGRGLLHCRLTLEEYLPGLDPGLTALDASHGLLAEATLTALERAYGTEGRAAVLRQAGVLHSQPVTQTEALARLVKRDASTLPARPTAGVPPAWHLDEVNVRAAWLQHWGGPDQLA